MEMVEITEESLIIQKRVLLASTGVTITHIDIQRTFRPRSADWVTTIFAETPAVGGRGLGASPLKQINGGNTVIYKFAKVKVDNTCK